jgi:tetratricopeptide (TPR) repeat protein
MRKQAFVRSGSFVLVALLVVAFLKFDSLEWRAHELRGWWLDRLNQGGDQLPTPVPSTPLAADSTRPPLQPGFEGTLEPTREPTAGPATPEPTPTPIALVDPPESVTLSAVKWEKQSINNCGPATLTMYLRYYGWQGTQDDVAGVVHPNKLDKNVRWDELVYYVKTNAGWLDALFRVGGTVEQMKRFMANGYPVVIETGYDIPGTGWVGHYLLLTGYDDAQEVFIVQDATAGANQKVPYAKIDTYWQQFNRLYIVVFPPADRDRINALLGDDADERANRQRALEEAQAEVESDPDNPFAQFNLGSNLNYFDRYEEAAAAFDMARELGLPRRMLFYQFGPYRAYFNLGRYQDVIDLSSFTLDYRPDLEESYFWRAWAEYMLGKPNEAVIDFRKALEVNPTFNDARVALESIGATP